MNVQAKATELRFRDLFRVDFWRQLVRIVWMFFPAIIFLAGAYFCFWKITQGKDLMVITLENPFVFIYFLVAQFFWAYTTWYTSRAVGKARQLIRPDENRIWTRLRVQFPRLLAFSCFTVIILAFFQLPFSPARIHPTICKVLLAGSIFYYLLLFRLSDKLINRKTSNPLKYMNSIRLTTWVILVAWFILVLILKSFAGLIIMLVALQAGLVLLLAVRRKLLEAKGESFYQKTDDERGYDTRSRLLEKLKGLFFDKEDKAYFIVFVIAGFAGIVIYLTTIASVSFSVRIGSFPFVLLAFSVLLILGNFVALFSVLFRFNLHGLLFAFAVLIGYINEPHYTQLLEKDNPRADYRNRQNLREYFVNWLNAPERKAVLNDTAVKDYPLYFVLANGGASRSGYWVASVLSRLEDTTGGSFSKHLFCLSGASGGSVGNATFFSLLRGKKNLAAKTNLQAAREYLGADFLTFTLARMLGPDVFRHIIPFTRSSDRAAALLTALEEASGPDTFLYDSLSAGFSRFITQKNDSNYQLPVLCINTTRMQDGTPGVISNITIDRDPAFNKRIDVLSLVNPEKDLSLGAAVVLGASFPYVSPAGRIDFRKDDTSRVRANYFVDGGYFDNSGAGVVNEMIIAIRDLVSKETDPEKRKIYDKLRFRVLHITNDPVCVGPALRKVNPLVNDLAAPLKTLLGSYGRQTAINDSRLKNYIQSLPGGKNDYRDIPLYRCGDSITYSMNWVISGHLLQAMDQRLEEAQISGIFGQVLAETAYPASGN